MNRPADAASPIAAACERCGTAALRGMHDYCARCGKNLCPSCLASGTCTDPAASDKQHVSGMVADYGAAAASPVALADSQGHTFCPGCWITGDILEPEHTYRPGDRALAGVLCSGCGEPFEAPTGETRP